MKHNLSLILSLCALAFAAGAFFRGPTPSPAPAPVIPSAPVPDETAYAPVTAPAPETVVIPATAPPQERDPQVIELLTALHTRLGNLEGRLDELKGGWEGLAQRGLVPLTDEHHARLLDQVLGAGSTEREKLAAYQLLRRHRKITDDLALAMVNLSTTSTDPKIQADALAALDGITNAAVVPSLVAALSNPDNARIRSRAADALGAFSNNPDVSGWLRHLAETDESGEVRREARQALYERFRRMGQEDLYAATLDSNLPDDEKVAALSRLKPEMKDTQILNSMIDLYLTSESPNLRADILRRMDGVTDPSFKAPLLNWLANEPDPRTRGEAAENLKHFRGDPTVLQWLQHAAANDTSPIVRKAADAALQGRDPR